MAQTAQAQVQDMIERASRLGDDILAAEIRAFAASRQFGLVFEHNRPERMRLYGKPISVGDVVQVLPERGKTESAESKLLWRVDSVNDDMAELSAYKAQDYSENDGEPRSAELADLVAVADYDQPIYAGLRETGRVERGGDKPYQVVINGENYHALESLLFCYAGKVDCIYIDPPYNTGAKDWKYNNDYVDGSDAYRHSKWLAMMERRLRLAKKLLNQSSSVLICTIDEKEYLRLGMLLEQVFPSASIQMVSIVVNPSGAKRDRLFSRSDEYAFMVLIGDAHVTHPEGRGAEQEVRWWYLRRTDYSSRRGTVKGGVAQFYPIYVDNNTGKIVKIGDPLDPTQPLSDAPQLEGTTAVFPIREDGVEMNWGLTGPSLKKLINEGVVRVTPSSNANQPYVFRYLSANYKKKVETGRWKVAGTREDGSKIVVEAKGKVTRATTTWANKAHDAGQYGTSLIGQLIGPTRRFSFPKSLYAVEDSLRFFVSDNPDALVLDFFAGSGTTAHAVMRLNHQDGGRRKCICITNNEVSEEEAKEMTKRNLRHGDAEWESQGICQLITVPRITAAITGLDPDGKPIAGEYKVKDVDIVDEFPMAEGFEENAVFFDLTYQNPDAVELGAAFKEVAPLLWLRAGARGSMIDHEEPGYAIADSYAVLFDYSYVREFVPAVLSMPNISCAFIVTDDSSRFASVKAELGGMECVRLYESYLRSFRIAAEDAAR